MDNIYAVTNLETFIETVLQQCRVSAEHARTTALRMLEADLRGMAAHGISRLPSYVKRFEAGGYNLTPDIRCVRETPISALVDGDNGLGQVVMTAAAEIAIDKATTSGMSWVGVRGSNHAGAGGVYASMALERDLIGIYMAVGNANLLPPWGGVDALMSTNPLAVAIPAGEQPPIVLDMATTVVAYGTIKLAAERGESIPTGWMIDRKGEPLTDPTRASEGFLLPIGGYKGYGLNLVIGALAGVLNGAAVGSATIDFNSDFVTPTNTGQLLILLRPDLFRPLEEFKAEMDLRIREIRESQPMDTRQRIRLPGEHVQQRTAEARTLGLTVDDSTMGALKNLAARLSIAAPMA